LKRNQNNGNDVSAFFELISTGTYQNAASAKTSTPSTLFFIVRFEGQRFGTAGCFHLSNRA
jgi:hypothetical protein